MQNVTPILDEDLTRKIMSGVIQFRKKAEWKALGMDKLRQQGTAMLFYGQPGTGKTVTARHIAHSLKMILHEMDFSMIGSDKPGELARNIKKLFVQAEVPDTHGQPSMVFLDECDTVLLSRSKLGSTSMWMLEPINALLREIGNYPGLVILATNQQPEFLDVALQRRLIGKFHFDKPDFLTRVKLWRSKYPRKLPLKLENGDVETLARYPLTGAEIENMIIEWVSDTMLVEGEYKFENLTETIRKYHNEK